MSSSIAIESMLSATSSSRAWASSSGSSVGSTSAVCVGASVGSALGSKVGCGEASSALGAGDASGVVAGTIVASASTEAFSANATPLTINNIATTIAVYVATRFILITPHSICT